MSERLYCPCIIIELLLNKLLNCLKNNKSLSCLQKHLCKNDLWRHLKMAVDGRSLSHLTEQEQFSHEEWAKISRSHCAKLRKTSPKTLITVIATKDASTKY